MARNNHGDNIAMNCPHLNNGRCKLSEKLAKDELSIDLECQVNERHCQRCVSRAIATEDAPTLEVLGAVFTVCPSSLKSKWRAYRDFITLGKPRGRGDRVMKVLDNPILKPFATAGKKVLAAVNGGDCGCKKRQKRLNEKYPNQRVQSSNASIQENPG